MKLLPIFVILASPLWPTCINAFPSYLSETMMRLREGNHPLTNSADKGNPKRCPFSSFSPGGANNDEKKSAAAAAGWPFAASKQKRQAPGVTPPFDPKLQYVSTSGAHAFVPPSGNDQRGPCKPCDGESILIPFKDMLGFPRADEFSLRPRSQRHGQPWLPSSQRRRHSDRLHEWVPGGLWDG